MNEVTIWHNPRCSKSRATLALIQDRGYEPRVRRYLDDAPSEAEIEQVLQMLECEPRDLLRTKQAEYRDLQLADENDKAILVRAMVDHPVLIERPIVICGGRAAIGRPPENVLEILEAPSS